MDAERSARPREEPDVEINISPKEFRNPADACFFFTNPFALNSSCFKQF